MQRHQPLLVRILALNLAIDALDVAIQHLPTWLDQDA
jgi:hypothetical protein